MFEYSRPPVELDYRAAAELHTETMARSGGAWAYSVSLEEKARTSFATRKKLTMAAGISNTVESMEHAGGDIDPFHLVTRAHKHGMVGGFEIIDLVHEGLVDYNGVIAAMNKLAVDRLGEESQQADRGEYFLEIGEQGFVIAGQDSRAIIEAWAEQYVRDLRLQRMYMMGVGATLLTANSIHRGYIEKKTQEMIRIGWENLII